MLNQHDDQVGGIIYFRINYCSIIILLKGFFLLHFVLTMDFEGSFQIHLKQIIFNLFHNIYSFKSSKRSNNYYFIIEAAAHHSPGGHLIIISIHISNYKCSIYLLLFPFLQNSYLNRQDNSRNKQMKSLTTPNDRCECGYISNIFRTQIRFVLIKRLLLYFVFESHSH